ncbi:hypothetical protein BKA56DRAFT_612487 [Ilyonectria sp. MPI-CAGE-AT-0026]|nr:hypothetical protein BKA56DRAFT_612487 [Ilyonectria sp. MPI-CAGE-AT-0026]
MTSSLECCDCSICGMPLDEMCYLDDDGQAPTRWYDELWKQDNVVLSGPHWCRFHDVPGPRTVTDDSVSCDAVDDRSTKYSPSVSFRHKLGSVVPQNEDPTLPGEAGYYIAIHSACLRIANLVMKRSPQAHIRSLADLWSTLERRCTKTGNTPLPTWPGVMDGPFLPSIPEGPPESRPSSGPVKLGTSRYFVHPWALGAREMDSENEEETFGDAWWKADPEYIPGLTAGLFANIEERGHAQDASSAFMERFDTCPREIKDHILGFVLCQRMPLECNYVLDQRYWRELFVQIPFLWDLDLAMVNSKLLPSGEDARAGSLGLDWEKLTRQVMTPVEVYKQIEPPLPRPYSQIGLDIPRGFQNRRRIWQILEEMYPNDVRVDGTENRWATQRYKK